MSIRLLSQIARRCSVLETGSCWVKRAFGDAASSSTATSASGKATWGSTSIGTIMKQKAESGAPSASLFHAKPSDTVFEAVKKMAAANVGSIVILKGDPAANDSVLGIITERDYMRNVVVAGKSSKDMKCTELMTPVSKLVTLQSKNSLFDAMNLIVENNIRHIPIIDNGKLRGMLSIKDIVLTLKQDHDDEMTQMSEYIGGSY